MRHLCDEFEVSHSDMRGYDTITSFEFEFTIMLHFLNKPEWITSNIHPGIVRTWALHSILSMYPAPKRSKLSIWWTSFKQWLLRKLNRPVRLTREQKEYYELLLGLTAHRNVIFVKSLEEMKIISSVTGVGITLMEDPHTPIMIMPLETNNDTSIDVQRILENIYIYDSEIIHGDDIMEMCHSIQEMQDRENEKQKQKQNQDE